MAALDISKPNNVIQITFGAAQIKGFSNSKANWQFSTAVVGTAQFELIIDGHSYNCSFAELTISGVAPVSVAAAYTSLGTLFPV